MSAKETLWSQQNLALRHPSEIFGTSFDVAGITSDTLKYKAAPSFAQLLNDLNITLVASREYENLLIGLGANSTGKLEQTFFHVPHPSGIAIDRSTNAMYVAATRNPNQVIEFGVTTGYLKRIKSAKPAGKVFMPTRAKYYPGSYYFHDLAICGGKLYANSVGMNCIVPVDFSNSSPEQPLWWPNCVDKNGAPETKANYIQLNSIAAGADIENSYFSASGAKISSRRPGHHNYPVDKQGVIFSGKTREPMGYGLTRPHAARLHNGKVWVANSGYGEVGYIENEQFVPVIKCNGWTRGLCFVGNILFVGVSRVLPRFRHYAPGITSATQECSIVAIDLENMKEIASVKFPYGNQLFAIDYISKNICNGLPFKSIKKTATEQNIFSVSLV